MESSSATAQAGSRSSVPQRRVPDVKMMSLSWPAAALFRTKMATVEEPKPPVCKALQAYPNHGPRQGLH